VAGVSLCHKPAKPAIYQVVHSARCGCKVIETRPDSQSFSLQLEKDTMPTEFSNELLTDFTKEENAAAMRAAIEKVRSQLGKEYPLVW